MTQPLIGNPISPSLGKLSRRGGRSRRSSEHPTWRSATSAATHANHRPPRTRGTGRV